jgi:Protein of unknown function (DUF1559)
MDATGISLSTIASSQRILILDPFAAFVLRTHSPEASMMRLSRRRAFTLFPLLALSALILVFFSILLLLRTQVQMVAINTQSQNNLKHIGIAMFTHQDSEGDLPNDYFGKGGTRLLSWTTSPGRSCPHSVASGRAGSTPSSATPASPR